MRLQSAIGYITPADKLAGKEAAIFAARDKQLVHAREARKAKRNENNTDLAKKHERKWKQRMTGILLFIPQYISIYKINYST